MQGGLFLPFLLLWAVPRRLKKTGAGKPTERGRAQVVRSGSLEVTVFSTSAGILCNCVGVTATKTTSKYHILEYFITLLLRFCCTLRYCINKQSSKYKIPMDIMKTKNWLSKVLEESRSFLRPFYDNGSSPTTENGYRPKNYQSIYSKKEKVTIAKTIAPTLL